jgi:hypothetical protein
MAEREARIKELRDVLTSPGGLAKVIETHVQVCGQHPRMELSPNAIIEAIVDCECDARVSQSSNSA